MAAGKPTTPRASSGPASGALEQRGVASRPELLGAHAELEEALLGLRATGAAADGDDGPGRALAAAANVLRDEYRSQVPYRHVSRCPFTDLVVVYPIDDVGLDGLWWRYVDPVRPAMDLVPTVYAITGAVALVDPVEETPFLVKSGPGVPYVLPYLLEPAGTRAVVSSLPVGRHTGYLTVYFSRGELDPVVTANEWAADRWALTPPQGDPWPVHRPELDIEIDTDLVPWIDDGRLSWIAPGDETLTLRGTVDDCPYLDVEGHGSGIRLLGGDRA